MKRAAEALRWFVDDEDLFYSRWRGVLLWALVVIGLVLIGWAISAAAAAPTVACPTSVAASGSC